MGEWPCYSDCQPLPGLHSMTEALKRGTDLGERLEHHAACSTIPQALSVDGALVRELGHGLQCFPLAQ
eukprot:50662-Eustigmatos_ZCMA.PRE.1